MFKVVLKQLKSALPTILDGLMITLCYFELKEQFRRKDKIESPHSQSTIKTHLFDTYIKKQCDNVDRYQQVVVWISAESALQSETKVITTGQLANSYSKGVCVDKDDCGAFKAPWSQS